MTDIAPQPPISEPAPVPLLPVIWRRSLLILLAATHALMLGWSATRHGFTGDEVGHLPAGVRHGELGKFDLFRVNPPLVRMVAFVPVLFCEAEWDWTRYSESVHERPEIGLGQAFLRTDGMQAVRCLVYARWAGIPFGLLGQFVCYLWSRELFGDVAGLIAATLWCFEPNILGHGQLITPDVAATSLGIAAAFIPRAAKSDTFVCSHVSPERGPVERPPALWRGAATSQFWPREVYISSLATRPSLGRSVVCRIRLGNGTTDEDDLDRTVRCLAHRLARVARLLARIRQHPSLDGWRKVLGDPDDGTLRLERRLRFRGIGSAAHLLSSNTDRGQVLCT